MTKTTDIHTVALGWGILLNKIAIPRSGLSQQRISFVFYRPKKSGALYG
jgi:hypothetical protein